MQFNEVPPGVPDARAALPRVLAALAIAGCSQPLWAGEQCAAAHDSPDSINEIRTEWRDEHSNAVRLSEWQGRRVLLTMAYSTCRQVCGYSLHRLEQLQQSADQAGTPIEIVVISYDPTIDSPATWLVYRQHHHLARSNWHFLTGTVPETQAFSRALDFPNWHYDEHVIHDFKILLIGADGAIARTLTWVTRNEELFVTRADGAPGAPAGDCK